MASDSVSVPEVFTLVPHDDRPERQVLSPDELRWLQRVPLDQSRNPRQAPPASPGLVFRRGPDGRVTADGFPDAADVAERLVARLAPHLAGVVRLERGRLYIQAANGAAVYVPVGASSRPGCTRYGRLYRRLTDSW